MEILGAIHTAGGKVKLCSCFGKVCQFLKRLNAELSYDPAVPLLGMHPRESKTCPHENMDMNVHSSIFATAPNPAVPQ